MKLMPFTAPLGLERGSLITTGGGRDISCTNNLHLADGLFKLQITEIKV